MRRELLRKTCCVKLSESFVFRYYITTVQGSKDMLKFMMSFFICASQ